MDWKTLGRVQKASGVVLLAAVAFTLFFFLSKNGPFGDTNPFNVDPYDVVGSFTFQIALLVAVLTYGRALRLRESPTAGRLSLVLRGNLVVLASILITLISDTFAEILSPAAASYWGRVLQAGLAVMWAMALIVAVVLLASCRDPETDEPPDGLTPADGIDDVWALVRVPAAGILPGRWARTMENFNSDRLFARVPWLHPRRRPWTFACLLALLAGAGLVAGYWQSGPPPSLGIGLVVSSILLYGEFCGAMLGFLTLGGYLGLRPRFH